jgi:beta-N-acetylhexosaminidase
MATASPHALLGSRFLIAFDGEVMPDEVRRLVAGRMISGVTLFRSRNVTTPAQVRRLTTALQAALPASEPPLLIGADQEGGQLQAIGEGATSWPGNLALGATRDPELAGMVGQAIGTELRAMGINLALAPVCDLLSPGSATVLGTRTFGDDPREVGVLAAAMVRGLQSSGVAATVKHLPGHGTATGSDPHLGLPLADALADEHERHLSAFGPPIRAGAKAALLGHVAVPSLTEGRMGPASLDASVVRLVRERLKFRGVTITDALDMGAIGPLQALPEHAVAAVVAGVDLLLTVHPLPLVDQARTQLATAASAGHLEQGELRASTRRIRSMRRRLSRVDEPSLEWVGCAAHRELARRVAERAVTRVRDRAAILPLHAEAPLTVLEPLPMDLTPAETSSMVRAGLADALLARGSEVTCLELPLDPSPGEAASLVAAIPTDAPVVVATLDSYNHPGQAHLIERLVGMGCPVVAVALRTPYDLDTYPMVGTFATAYGVQPPNQAALADALLGRITFAGRLPVRVAAAEEAR